MVKIYRFILCMTVAVMVGCTADIPFTWTEPGSSTTTTEFTAELDTIIHEYDGTTATDAADDVVGSDKDLYWESNKFTSKINVTYSGNEATVETSLSDVETYIDGAYVAINMAANGVKNVEIIVKGATEDGALKIYGKNKSTTNVPNGCSCISTMALSILYPIAETTWLNHITHRVSRLTPRMLKAASSARVM
jgi:hypothetical protein